MFNSRNKVPENIIADSRPITLIYTNCRTLKLGDFSITGELSYALQTYYSNKHINSQCILATSEEGLNCFKKLYSNANSNDLKIYDLHFKVVVFEKFLQTKDARNVINYIEVAHCKPAPVNLVSELVRLSHPKVLFVGIPNSYHQEERDFRASVDYSSESVDFEYSCVSLGFGKNRIGVPVWQGKKFLTMLTHELYENLTQSEFGLVYFNGDDLSFTHPNKIPYAVSYIQHYLDIAIKFRPSCRNFILIGNGEASYEGIKLFANHNPNKKIKIYNRQEQKILMVEYAASEQALKVKEIFYDENTAKEEADLNIVILPRVSHDEMLTLMTKAMPFVGVTGVASSIEALNLGKLPFFQYLPHNRHFHESYETFVKEDPRVKEDQKEKISRLLEFMTYCKIRSLFEINYLVSLLIDKDFITLYNNINKRLMNQSSNPIPEICQRLTVIPQGKEKQNDSRTSEKEVEISAQAFLLLLEKFIYKYNWEVNFQRKATWIKVDGSIKKIPTVVDLQLKKISAAKVNEISWEVAKKSVIEYGIQASKSNNDLLKLFSRDTMTCVYYNLFKPENISKLSVMLLEECNDSRTLDAGKLS